MSAMVQRVSDLVSGVLAELPDDVSSPGPVRLYDVEYAGGTLRIVLQREGGLDVGAISSLTRSISAALDDADPIEGSYTLEVSSPGLERRLRTSAHFEGAVGELVSFKLRPGVEGDRRFVGRVAAASGDTVTVSEIPGGDGDRVVRLDDVTKAQIHVDWTPPPKPGRAQAKRPERATDSERTNHSEAT